MKSTEKQGKTYAQRLTTTIIMVYAAIILFSGLFVVILGIFAFFSEKIRTHFLIVPYVGILYGLGIILVGSLVYIIGALSKDVYNILYYCEYMASENENFHLYMGKRMNEIEVNQEQIRDGISRVGGRADREKNIRIYNL